MRQREPRIRDEGYLAWLREQHCACGCRQFPPCDAAHLRAASLAYAKPLTGMGRKPHDFWALPLKHNHHMSQHAFGNELLWWAVHGVVDPWALCLQYYKRYAREAAPKATVRRKTIWPSRPMQSRPFAKIHRPMRKAP